MAQAVDREGYGTAAMGSFTGFNSAGACTICNTRRRPRISIAPMTVDCDISDWLMILVMDCNRHHHTPILTSRIYSPVQIANMNTCTRCRRRSASPGR